MVTWKPISIEASKEIIYGLKQLWTRFVLQSLFQGMTLTILASNDYGFKQGSQNFDRLLHQQAYLEIFDFLKFSHNLWQCIIGVQKGMG